MNKSKNLPFLEKIKRRKNQLLRVEEVFQNTELEKKTIYYLKKQPYLEFSKINILINRNFENNYPFGNVLINKQDEIIGFLGTKFSKRININEEYILCNLHTWIVDESHRLNSYLLLIPVVERNCSINTFTPLKTLIGLYEKFGFQKLKMRYRFAFSLNLFDFFKYGRFIINQDKDFIEKNLDKDQLQIYQDHKNLSCIKFIVIDKNDSSNKIFVIALKKKNKFFNILDLLYVSNNKYLKKNWSNLNFHICLKFKVLFLGQNFLYEDDCSIPENILFSKDKTKEICVKGLPSNYKFDTLYSEFVY